MPDTEVCSQYVLCQELGGGVGWEWDERGWEASDPLELQAIVSCLIYVLEREL